MQNIIESGHHFIAIFGGAVAGSEAAYQLASRGFRVVVFDQNILPYGKIEDGLPKWHVKLRDKEERLIDEKLSHENILFVPGIKLGETVEFKDVVQNWGFSAVLLATGAWKDRPLPIEGIDAYINKGFVYQNPLMYWFNHYHEPDYQGTQYDIVDDAVIIGGGLASLDVAKLVMIETVQKALAEQKNIHLDMFSLEHSIAKVLEKLELNLDDLGLKGCTLYYRRRDEDMPLSSMPAITDEQKLKVKMVARKILENFKNKYLFRFEPCCVPIDKIVENGHLKGIKFQKVQIEDDKIVYLENQTIERHSHLVISSIGSIPEKIEGIPNKASGFLFKSPDSCQLADFESVFALGNAVTGRGNIIESQHHSRDISVDIMENYLKWTEEDYERWMRSTESGIQGQISEIAQHIGKQKYMTKAQIEHIISKVTSLWKKVGYNENYQAWADKNRPVRLENLLTK